MKPPVNESTKCTQLVRKIALEFFQLPKDRRKGKQAARSRQGFLVWLSTWANGDGSFVGANGIDYSPSEKTIAKHYAKSSYYLLSNELKELGWLSWKRKQTHYGRRSFTIHLENQVPDAPKTPPTFTKNTSKIQTKTPPTFTEHLQDSSITPPPLRGDNTSTPWHNPSYLAPASMRTETQRTFADVAVDSNGGAQTQTDAVDGATPHDISAVLPKPPRPSAPTTGRQVGTGEERQTDDEPATAETRRRIEQDSQQEYTNKSAKAFRALPQSIRDQVSHLRQRCRADWDYWRTHDEDGDALDEDHYRFGAFPSPKSHHLLKLAEMRGTYTESQILGAWKKFLNRPDEIEGLTHVWANFFQEFNDYVEDDQTVGAV
jgi:hypothetical protein